MCPNSATVFSNRSFIVQQATAFGTRKLVPTKLQRHSLGRAGVDSGVGELLGASKFMSAYPHLDVNLGAKIIPCLVDTGSTVTTITQTCFHQILPLVGAMSNQWYSDALPWLFGTKC